MTQEVYNQDSAELATEFEVPYAKLIVRDNPAGWHSSVAKKGDRPMDFTIVNARDQVVYKGAVLLRKGKVHFYDRYPMGGGPFRIRDFTDPEFRATCELVAKNIESLVK